MKRQIGRVCGWLRTLSALSEEGRESANARREPFESGRLALQLAESLAAPATPAERPELRAVALANARAAVAHLTAAAADPPGSAAVNAGSSPRPEDPTRDLEELIEQARSLRSMVEGPLRRQRAVRRRAWARALAVPAGVVLLLFGAAWRLFGAQEISAGKPWKTSSVAMVCEPERISCGGAITKILFHTNNEADPWFEIDLGGVYEVSRLTVKNRHDSCPDCAVPLFVETSLDHASYQTIARRFSVFDEWTQRLPATRARYVRLRVPRVTRLHLEAVRVYGRRA
jgi:F5/8 type C domain